MSREKQSQERRRKSNRGGEDGGGEDGGDKVMTEEDRNSSESERGRLPAGRKTKAADLWRAEVSRWTTGAAQPGRTPSDGGAAPEPAERKNQRKKGFTADVSAVTALLLGTERKTQTSLVDIQKA